MSSCCAAGERGPEPSGMRGPGETEGGFSRRDLCAGRETRRPRTNPGP